MVGEKMLLQVRNLTKEYPRKIGTPVKALSGINLAVSPGEFIVIVGRSGSGKTTLLNIIGTLDRQTKGEVLFEGKNLGEYSNKELALLRRNKVGFIFQTFNLLPTLTVNENIEIALLHNIQEVQKKEKINRLLDFLELSDKINSLPHELSVGQQQKVAIARALVKDPILILADEPTGEMDPLSGKEIIKKLLELKNKYKVTLIFATHSPFSYELADRVLFIKDGEFVSKNKSQY
jgi:ABC-type lipoprotein export system ATPase subunit